MRFTTKLLPSRIGNLGILTLNNPNTLHALTIDMCYTIQDILQVWYKNNNETNGGINSIVIQADNSTVTTTTTNNNNNGSNKKRRLAFCAGGDIKEIYTACKEEHEGSAQKLVVGQGRYGQISSDFFRHEYIMNYMLSKSPIPIVSILDGVTMGGGVGISAHGKYPVVTENTIWAMPETAIGLFPDVGSTYWMPRFLLPNVNTALYLALTGKRLTSPSDLLYTGIGTHYIPSDQLPKLQKEIIYMSEHSKATDILAPMLMLFHKDIQNDIPSSLQKIQKEIDYAFGGIIDQKDSTVYDIVTKLNSMDTEFSRETVTTLNQMSPTSLIITLESMKRGLYQCQSIEECFHMEYRLSQACISQKHPINNNTINDFYEGVRSMLIDKDNQPQWYPKTLEDAIPNTSEIITSYFDQPIEYEWEIPNDIIDILKKNKTK